MNPPLRDARALAFPIPPPPPPPPPPPTEQFNLLTYITSIELPGGRRRDIFVGTLSTDGLGIVGEIFSEGNRYPYGIAVYGFEDFGGARPTGTGDAIILTHKPYIEPEVQPDGSIKTAVTAIVEAKHKTDQVNAIDRDIYTHERYRRDLAVVVYIEYYI